MPRRRASLSSRSTSLTVTSRSAAAVLAAAGALLAAGCSTSPTTNDADVERDADGAAVEEGEVGAFQIRVGDCIADLELEEEIESVEAVACDSRHRHEAYAVFELDGDDDAEFPGATAVTNQAGEGCLEAFETFVDHPYETSIYDFDVMFPTEQTWTLLDDREVICFVSRYDGTDKVGSAENAGE